MGSRNGLVGGADAAAGPLPPDADRPVVAATRPDPTPRPGRGKGALRPCGTAGGGP